MNYLRKTNPIIVTILLLAIVSSCSSNKKNKKEKFDDEFVEIYQEEPKKKKEKIIMGFNISKNDNLNLYIEADDWLGVPYKYGGNSKDGTDCSGMVYEIYKSVFNKKLERNSSAIMANNCKKIDRRKLSEGDLIFFATGKNKNKINHVGLYLKDGKFIHSSSSRGVIISSMDEKYYDEKFVCAGRVN